MARKPTPSYLKIVKGNPGKRPINEHEPKPKPLPRKPPAPPRLTGLAKDEWDRVVEQLWPLGLVTGVDTRPLEAYCTAYGRWAKAEEAIAEMAKSDPLTGALMIKTKAGNVIQNPLVGVANKSMADMVRFAAEFGMTPSARSRINAKPPGEEESPAEGYFDN